jgi:putative addiction module component (TIGR02574 family)
MIEFAQRLLQEALSLSPTDRALLIDALVSTLDQADPSIDQLWAQEAENRLNAYQAGELEVIASEVVFEELKTL